MFVLHLAPKNKIQTDYRSIQFFGGVGSLKKTGICQSNAVINNLKSPEDDAHRSIYVVQYITFTGKFNLVCKGV